MAQYLYFSYYDALNNCVGYNIEPSPVENPTPDWVSRNVIVEAPAECIVAVVSLDTVPPSNEPDWLEIYIMEPGHVQKN